MTKLITRWLRPALVLLILAYTQLSLANTLSADVDRNSISENETLTLSVKYQGERVDSDPDFSGLSQQFDVLQNQKSMQHSVINGQINSSTEWTLTLAPKNAGQLLIPPFSLRNAASRPININVNAAAASAQTGGEEVFLETAVDQTEGYVQEQFIITYRLYYNRRVDNLDMPELSAPNTRIEALPRVDYQKTLGTTTYGVSEFRYALFADVSGEVKIDAQVWTVRTTDQASINRFGFGGGRYKLHRVKTQAINFQVQAKPAEYPNNAYWLPAQELSLSEKWSQDPKNFKLGEPITRSITITAVGASAEQLPELLTNTAHPDFKFYPDKPVQDTQLQAKGVVGTRTESIAIVPTKTGALTLPEVTLTWWDSRTNQLQVASLPALSVNVQASANSTQSPAQIPAIDLPSEQEQARVSSAEPTQLWPWVTALLALSMSNLVVLALWLRARGRSREPVPQSSAKSPARGLEEIKQACKERSAKQLYQALTQWLVLNYPERPATLASLAELAADNNLQDHLERLQTHLYKDSSTQVDYSFILNAMKKIPRKDASSVASAHAIPALYPS